MLATHLPPEAAVWRVGPDDMLWTRETQMIAGLRDDLRGLLLGDDMTPVPRPSDPPPTRPALDVGDKAARFRARQRQKQATESG